MRFQTLKIRPKLAYATVTWWAITETVTYSKASLTINKDYSCHTKAVDLV